MKNLLGDLRDLLPKPQPAPVPYPRRMIYEKIMDGNLTSCLLDAQFPVEQAVLYNPTSAVLFVNHSPTIPDDNRHDYAILPYSMFIFERFTERQIGATLSGMLAVGEKALVSLLYGYADFVRYATSITPVTPPMPRPVLAVYIIDTNGDFVLSSGGQFVVEA